MVTRHLFGLGLFALALVFVGCGDGKSVGTTTAADPTDGVDGADRSSGMDAVDGVDGNDGADGIDSADGEIPANQTEALVYHNGVSVYLAVIGDTPVKLSGDVEVHNLLGAPVAGTDRVLVNIQTQLQSQARQVIIADRQGNLIYTSCDDCFQNILQTGFIEETGLFWYETSDVMASPQGTKQSHIITVDAKTGAESRLLLATGGVEFGRATADGNALTWIASAIKGKATFGTLDLETGDGILGPDADGNTTKQWIGEADILGTFLAANKLQNTEGLFYVLSSMSKKSEVAAANPRTGEFTVLATLNDNTWMPGLLRMSADGSTVFVTGEHKLWAVQTDGSGAKAILEREDNLFDRMTVTPNGRYGVRASQGEVVRRHLPSGTELTLEFKEGEPWYGELGDCTRVLDPIAVSNKAFVLTTRGGTIGGGCPQFDPSTSETDSQPVEFAEFPSWLVRLDDLSVTVIDDTGPVGPTFSKSGAFVAYVAEEGACAHLLAREVETGDVTPVDLGHCPAGQFYWVTLPTETHNK